MSRVQKLPYPVATDTKWQDNTGSLQALAALLLSDLVSIVIRRRFQQV